VAFLRFGRRVFERLVSIPEMTMKNIKVGKLYRLEPDTVRLESVDILDPGTGEIVWPIWYHWQSDNPWRRLETTPLLLVEKRLFIEPPPNSVVNPLDTHVTEFSLLFVETLVTVVLSQEADFIKHFYLATK